MFHLPAFGRIGVGASEALPLLLVVVLGWMFTHAFLVDMC